MQTESRRRLGWKFRALILLLLTGVLAAALLLGTSWSKGDTAPVITSDLLGQQLRTVEELATVEYHYTNVGKYENQVDFYGWKVPFTTKSFLVSYEGIIKAGIDLSAAAIEIDENRKIIMVSLPKAKILSHEIPEDSIEVFDEKRNIFNPITIRDYTGFTRDQKFLLEEKSIQNGLLTAASEKAVSAVEALLPSLPGMEAYILDISQAAQ